MSFRKIFHLMSTLKIYRRIDAHKIALSLQKDGQKTKFKKLFYVGPTMMSLWTFQSTKDAQKNYDKEAIVKEAILLKADDLYDQGLYKQLYDLLYKYKDSKDVEFLWRLCRALYNMSKTANKAEADTMILEAYDLINTAKNIKEDHCAVHKWMAILIDSKSSMEGIKARLEQMYAIRNHMLRAIELDPKDPTALYMLGNWCYQVSNLAWYQIKIVSVIFGETPPRSSFEEALTYFEKAEETSPNFYSHNLLMLAKTYLKLHRRDDALRYLKRTIDYPCTSHDDVQAKKEAQELLNGL